jgi:deazaflavin-dependent oxidoreductase (nitroreductase family)
MPLPKRLARFNRSVSNPLLRPLAARLPGFAIVSHTGRRSGRRYSNPVNLFRSGDRYVIALTYGADAQWVRNVLAAGACEIQTRGRRIELAEPKVVRDPRRALVPAGVRQMLRVLDVEDFMLLSPRRPPSPRA